MTILSYATSRDLTPAAGHVPEPSLPGSSATDP